MNIALFLPNWVGDVVMATPAIRALREHSGNARFVAVCRPYVFGALEGSPWFDAHVFLDRAVPWANCCPRSLISCAVSRSTWPCSFRTRFARAWSPGLVVASGASVTSAMVAAGC